MSRKTRLHKTRQPASARGLRVETLEDRDLPSFVAAPSFTVGVNSGGLVPQGSKPIAVAVGDFNRDGRVDVVTANQSGPGISLLKGNGAGGFLARVNFATGPAPTDILAVDLNNDGRLDIVTTNEGNDKVTVLRGNGDGTFKPALAFSVGLDPSSVTVADFNGDGKKDLAVANKGANTVTVLLGTGTGGFTAGPTVTVGTNPTSVAAADFNNDGKPDLASVSGGFGHLDINLNNGNGIFAPQVNYETGFVANSVVVGFFNADAQPDLAVACDFPSDDGVSILLGNADGTFQTFTNYDAGEQTPVTLAVADMNADGIQDLVTANGQFGNNSISVLTGTGTGAFSAARVYTAGQGPEDVAVADFNSDGILDVVTANFNGDVGNVSILRGNGNGTLSAARNLIVSSPGPIVAAELTGDGLADLAVLTTGGGFNGVGIFPGAGNGAFGAMLQGAAINQATGLAVRDLDGDQHKDLVITTGAGVTIALGNGNGTFDTPVNYAAGSGPKWVAIDDFNNDLLLDLAVANNDAGGVSILLGNGDGTFDPAMSILSGGVASYIETGDFNRDGKRDLAVIHDIISDPKVSVLLGLGTGGFGAPKSYKTRNGPGSVGVGDFNRDGKQDLAVPTFFGFNGHSALKTFRNGTAGSFVGGPEYATDSRPVGISVGDFTGDGKLDLAVVNNFDNNLFLFPGTGLGTFGAPKKFVVGSRPDWVASADFNGDGKLDLAVTNSIASTITLLQTPTPATTFRVSIVSATTTAGVLFKVVVTAVEAGGRIATGFNGTVRFTSSDLKAVLPLAYRFTAADNGVKRFNVTLKTAGTQSVTVSWGAVTGTDSVDVVSAAANHFGIAAPTTTTAGVPFDLTVTALDPFNNVATSYARTVRFTSTASPLADLPGNYTFLAGDNGVKTFTVTLKKAGLQTVTVLDTLIPTMKKSASLTVAAGPVSQFLVSGFPLTTQDNVAHPFTVTARDEFGNTVTNYLGTVEFEVTGGTALLPVPYTFTAANLGRRTFSATFLTLGPNQSLIVRDNLDPMIAGSQNGITVI